MLSLGRFLQHAAAEDDHNDGLLEQLVQRVSEAVLLPDRREAMQQLRDLLVSGNSRAQMAFGAVGLQVALGVVRDREDLEMVQQALECLAAAVGGGASDANGGGGGVTQVGILCGFWCAVSNCIPTQWNILLQIWSSSCCWTGRAPSISQPPAPAASQRTPTHSLRPPRRRRLSTRSSWHARQRASRCCWDCWRQSPGAWATSMHAITPYKSSRAYPPLRRCSCRRWVQAAGRSSWPARLGGRHLPEALDAAGARPGCCCCSKVASPSAASQPLPIPLPLLLPPGRPSGGGQNGG